MYQNPNKSNSPPPIVFIIAIGLIGFGAYKFFPGLLNAKNLNTATSTSTPPTIA